MLNLELLAQGGDHSIIQICTIISEDSLWDTVSTDEILFHEPGDHILSNGSEGSCLNPLCKIVDGH